MSRRVVVTGLGVIAPNGNGLAEFELALRKGRSGLAFQQSMAAAGPPPSAAGTDMMAQLNQLSQLHTQGVLTDEEFAAAKAKLLAGG